MANQRRVERGRTYGELHYPARRIPHVACMGSHNDRAGGDMGDGMMDCDRPCRARNRRGSVCWKLARNSLPRWSSGRLTGPQHPREPDVVGSCQHEKDAAAADRMRSGLDLDRIIPEMG